jgi:poly(hydroxyalkanoate) depolymerase family esterase
MTSTMKIAEMMYKISELMIELGPQNTMKTMQRVFMDMVTPVDAENRSRLMLPGGWPSMACAETSDDITPPAPRSVNKRMRRKSSLPKESRISPLWRYQKVRVPAITGQHIKACAEIVLPKNGKFLNGSVINNAGTRNYKLYVPSCYYGQPLPLVVMLHGCKQDPDDFATGTRMNMIAEEKQCFVLYPAQAKVASRPKCWNWFRTVNQQRDRGEPSLIADMTREVIRNYHVNESMIYIAGLSAGGAMAAIMAKAYPEMFAAAAVHSGVPCHAANNLYSAIFAMKHGAPTLRRKNTNTSETEIALPTVPMIVFHGDADTVVHPDNGDMVVKQVVSIRNAATSEADTTADNLTSVTQGELAEGRSYTRTIHHDKDGQRIAEQWLIHGSGHAWSGGSNNGSYTDPLGPDATNEMMRFFYEQEKQD